MDEISWLKKEIDILDAKAKALEQQNAKLHEEIENIYNRKLRGKTIKNLNIKLHHYKKALRIVGAKYKTFKQDNAKLRNEVERSRTRCDICQRFDCEGTHEATSANRIIALREENQKTKLRLKMEMECHEQVVEENAKLRKLLRELEWASWDEDEQNPRCFICNGAKTHRGLQTISRAAGDLQK